MSRLYDRVMAHGCEPLRISYLQTGHEERFEHGLRVAAAYRVRSEKPTVSEDELAARVDELMALWSEPEATETFDLREIEESVVVTGDEVARYLDLSLQQGEDVDDRLGVIMPPFPSIWVEAQGAPNIVNANAWGAVMTVVEDRSMHAATGDPAVVSALLEAPYLIDVTVVTEWKKGHPVGPCLVAHLGLSYDGHWLRQDDHLVAAGSLPEFDFITPEEMKQMSGMSDSPRHVFLSLLSPLLLTVSFMHCRNVSQSDVEPPPKLSARHRRKTGRPLVTYRVLDIQPMREILDREGEAQTRGLGHALHICRGHFKTYTPEAPLMGKHVGTYWWPAQARGKAEHGVVEKDYRIRLDQGLGREYIEADEHAEITPDAPEHTGLDPDLGGRGLRAHNLTQNLLARAVRNAGHEPRRPKPEEPQYDLAWEAGDVTWVAEVKSITPRNEEKQLRTALGQVLRYRQLLEEDGRTVKAMIATEAKPSDPTWSDLCEREDIALIWGPDNLTVA